MNLQRATIIFMLCVLSGVGLTAAKKIHLDETRYKRPGKSLGHQQVQGYLNDDNTLVLEFPKSYGEIDVLVTNESNNQIIYQDNHLVTEPLLTLTIPLEQLMEGIYHIHIQTRNSVIDGYFEVE